MTGMETSHTNIGRRELLQAGTVALFSGASPLLSAPRLNNPLSGRGTAKRCILVYLLGGPPHQDMWDMKPDAPSEIRGPFNPVSTSVPGIHICEHLPRLASQTNRLSIIRSAGYKNSDHPFMTYYTLTGRISPTPLGANTVLPPTREDDPHIGAVINKFAHKKPAVPGYVSIPELRVRMQLLPVAGGGRAGYLGPEYDPLMVNEDPRKADAIASLSLPKNVNSSRHSKRKQLLAMLDGDAKRPRLRDYDKLRRVAMELTDGAVDDGLFDINKEPAGTRELYGDHRFGQSLLMARRLVERDVSFVGVHFNYMSKCDGWDTHQNNFPCLKHELLPLLDEGLSGLITDLEQRGMLDETLVVCMGEFGRTPKINNAGGRDHWGQCGSVVMAGGGVKGGHVIGASDKHAALPTQTPVGPPDIVASIYHALGLNPHALIVDPRLNRTLQLCEGDVIKALF
tara:strand:- start:1597 stop:2958 length:1362 start_codon:yes stop_codon:yes gene_type:complete